MVAPMPVRAEFPSLARWLSENLDTEERSHIGLVTLNQWPFTTAALAETALTAHGLGAAVTVGFWADDTPLADPGWTTNRRLAHAVLSRSLDENAARALVEAGLPSEAMVRPPIRRWHPSSLPAPPDPLVRSSIRALRYRGSGMGRSILQVHPDNNTPIRDDFEWPRRYIAKAIESYAWVYDQTLALIRRRGIRTLVVFNGRFTHDQAAAAAANEAGIKVLYYDAGGLETGFDLTFSTTHDWVHLQERMLRMWDEWPDPERQEIGARWFLDRQEHKEPGLRAFVEHQRLGYLEGLPEAEQLVVFFSSSPDEIAELELDWAEYLQSQEHALATLAEACRERPGTQLIVRTHPHMRLKPADDLRDWRAAVTAAGPSVHYDAGDPADSYALMRRSDIVFTYGSTSGVESAFIGRPVVVMGPSAYDVLGCATRARSLAQIRAALDQPPAPAPDRALPYGLMMERRGFNFEHVTRSSEGTWGVGSVEFADAREIARKIGQAQQQRALRRLTH
jgi:hypothetical protein